MWWLIHIRTSFLDQIRKMPRSRLPRLYNFGPVGRARSIEAILADANLNVVDMVNKSRGEIAYNIIDVEGELFEDLRAQISAVDGVMRVRFI